ncbi:ricin B lectin domain-containing protein [Daedaleopsis nitida]|nr:ricin B lectin domain-containing protein [Daedaleopsis nitida]
MPGAEPPTPAPEPVFEKTEDQRSPEPDTVQVQGYDTQDVPHIFHDNPQASVEPDLEAGLIPPVGSFEVEEAQRPQSQEAVEAELAPQPDAARTPRVELKPEEGLAPLDIGAVAPPSHAVEGSDATAVAVSPRIGSPATKFAPGTYVLLNARSGTAMDLSGADGKTVIGYSMHGGPNQQWEFIPTGHGYIIRCVRRSKEGHALYLTTAGGLRDGEEIVASTFPVTWNVEQTEDGIRISWPNSEYVFDLADWGNSAPGTKIQLATRKSSEACQHWHYTRCAPASDPEPQTDGSKEVGREAVSARAVSPPATTETVTVTEERDFVTTTRTTTTTVITTVTEVTRTPKSMFRQIALPQRRSIAYR